MPSQQIKVRRETRTFVEYLVQLLERYEFIENTIDTVWLDGIFKEKSVQIEKLPHLIVTATALFIAFQHVKSETESVMESFRKGQLSTSEIL